MKHQFIGFLSLATLLGATSCSQELEDPSNGPADGLTTVSVNIPLTQATSRAVPEIPAGYKLRCIMQLVDARGAAIADQRYVSEVAPGSENVEFTFVAPADGYQGAMFWADYVEDLNTDYIYTTSDLKAIGYNEANTAAMFNNEAADAFYGYMLAGNNSISLARPFTRITFKCADNNYADYTTVKVAELPAPASFNVLNGNTASYAEGIASDVLDVAEDGVWFSTYLFVGNNSGASLGEGHDIALTLGGAKDLDLTVKGTDVPLTRNYDITALVSASAGDVTNIVVTFPGGMIDPDKPRDIAVGDFVNADGSYTTTFDADKAVAIVYALASADDPAVEGKTPVAYAFALTNTSRVKLASADDAFAGTATLSADLYDGAAGSAAWQAFVALAESGSPLLTAFNTWAGDHTITGSNLSAWYAPSASQLRNLVGTLFNGGEWTVKNLSGLNIDFPARDTDVYNAYKTAVGEGSFTHDGNVANFFACEVSSDSRVLGIQVDEANHTIGAVAGKETNPFIIRPVLTVFK